MAQSTDKHENIGSEEMKVTNYAVRMSGWVHFGSLLERSNSCYGWANTSD